MSTPRTYRFTFGPWNISQGADPFGPVVRKEVAEFRSNRFVITTMAILPFVFLITPMITGRKRNAAAHALQFASAWLALELLLIAVAAVSALAWFGGW